jgi:chemotaxis protein CheC
MNLTPMQHDALLESFNIAVARAAVSLSHLLREEIQISVPDMGFLNLDDATIQLCQLYREEISVVTQFFEGDIQSRAMLITPSSSTRKIVRLAVGDLVTDSDLPEFEEEAIAEVGNILLNACIATLANQLRLDLRSTPPSFVRDDPKNILSGPLVEANDRVLMVHISLTIRNYQIVARLAFLLDARSNSILATALNQLIERYAHGVLAA